MGRLASIRPGDIVRIRDERWRVAFATWHGELAILDVGGWDQGNRTERARFLWPVDDVEKLPSPHAPRILSPARWRQVARRALATAVPRVDSLRAASSANVDVIPFQLEPALAVTRGLGCRILIADEVGLGKTIQAGLIIAELLERTSDGHVLVVSPAALREQWQRELEDRFHLSCAVFDAAGLARTAALAGPAANPWQIPSVVITSIDFVKRPEVIRALESMLWDAAVFDEAHALAGVSDRATAAAGLARRARVVVLLSATPHSGDDAAFARLCSTGELSDRAPLLLFRRSRRDAGLDSRRRTRWLRVRSTPAELAMHRSLLAYARLVWRQDGPLADTARLAMLVLVKRACSSAASLARSIERRLLLTQSSGAAPAQLDLPLDLSGSADAEPLLLLAAAGLGDGRDEHARLEELLALARAASTGESKVAAVGRLVRRGQQPAIVFTEYRDTLSRLEQALSGVDTLQLHGGLTLRERREVVGQFTKGPARVLLATDAASEGLNLHHRCRLVINLELPWTPLRLEQRVGRVDRIGQRAPVHAVHLIAGNTEEERTVARLIERSARAGSALAGEVVDEDEVARHVFERPQQAAATRAHPRPGSREPAGRPFVMPNLSDAAGEEAGRVVGSRSLRRSGGLDTFETRPAVSVIRKRSSSKRQCLWAYRISFLDRAGRVVWSTVLGATARAAGGSARDDLVRALIAGRFEAERVIATGQQAALAQMTAGLARVHGLAVQRERAIAADLRRTRARLASVQPGLFDRRAVRAAATAGAVLDAALGRCTAKLDELDASDGPVEGPRELVFAVALG
jgi:superfamily II DNA or RNA helicase